ncbi:MAG: hypothetical protein CMI54_05930 [Parcubacteria group bacterium]|nr:hypothetical protein [Parcubacteria group bacterium]|tara:strand:+ start:19191 stop:19850 length:660 start_codon:yes stop_codon:yes gene_type:complete
MKNVIGISGVAGVGKDTFFSLLSEKIPCERFSLADALKKEVNQWCRMHYGIDSVTCSREEKEIIRPFLVFHGSTKRKQTEGRHWIEKLQDEIVRSKGPGLKVVTDIRYDDYENDEASWLQNELSGKLIHLSMYTMEPDMNPTPQPSRCGTRTLVKKYRAPINSEEARNDPKLIKKSDYRAEWKFINNGQINELEPYIDNFLSWLLDGHEEERAMRQHVS